MTEPDDCDPYEDFQKDLQGLLNKHNIERRTDTPSFILAEYVVATLRALEHHHYAMKCWLSPKVQKPTNDPKLKETK